jgi:predicted ATP-dependent Lon-type protease
MVIVSYADTAQGHIGYVYQATNFLFTGTTKERTDMDAGEGKHSRHGTDPSVRKFRSAKHRYIYIHGSKTQKAKLLKDLNYEIQQYPKGEIKRYDSGAKVITQQLLFG